PRLADRYRVICLDLRGFGWSDAPRDGYAKERLAADVIALLDALHIARAGLIGHDWGGWIGFLACLRAPRRFTAPPALHLPHPFQRPDTAMLAYLPRTWYQLIIEAPVLGPWLLRQQPGWVRWILRHGVVDPAAFSEADLELFAERLRDPARAHAAVALYR